MSLFRRTPKEAQREYESWEPAADAGPDEIDLDAPVKSGRSRTGTEHLAAARDVLDAGEQKDR